MIWKTTSHRLGASALPRIVRARCDTLATLVMDALTFRDLAIALLASTSTYPEGLLSPLSEAVVKESAGSGSVVISNYLSSE